MAKKSLNTLRKEKRKKERERKRELKQQDYKDVFEGKKPLSADGKAKEDLIINKQGRYGLKSRRNHLWLLVAQEA